MVDATASLRPSVLIPASACTALALSVIEAAIFHVNFFISLIVFAGVLGAILLLARERLRWRQRLFDHIDDLADIERGTWGRFEGMAAELLRSEGYAQVIERGGFNRDFGVDIEAHKYGRKVIVQCRRWRNRVLGVAEVYQVAGVVARHKAASGILVTTGKFTHPAKQEAPHCHIELIEGPQLVERLRKAGLIPSPRLEVGPERT